MLVQTIRSINEILESRHIGPSRWFNFFNDSTYRHKSNYTLEEITHDQKFAQSLTNPIDMPQPEIDFLLKQGLIETKTEGELIDEFGFVSDRIGELYRQYDGLGKTKRELEARVSDLKKRNSKWSRVWCSKEVISQREQQLGVAEQELANLPSFEKSFEKCARLTKFIKTKSGTYIAPTEEANHILYTIYRLYDILKMDILSDSDLEIICTKRQNLGYDGEKKVVGWLDAAKKMGKHLDYTIDLFGELAVKLKKKFEGDFYWSSGELKQGSLLGGFPSDHFVIQDSLVLANRMREQYGDFDVEPRWSKPRYTVLEKPNLFVSFDIESLVNEGREAGELVCTIYDLTGSSDNDKVGLKFHYWSDHSSIVYGINPPVSHWDSIMQSSLVALSNPHLFATLQKSVAEYLSHLGDNEVPNDYAVLGPIEIDNKKYVPCIKVNGSKRVNPTIKVDYRKEESGINDSGVEIVTGHTPICYDQSFKGREFHFCLKFERQEPPA